MEVTAHGQMAHVAIPDSGVDALQVTVHILSIQFAKNTLYKQVCATAEGFTVEVRPILLANSLKPLPDDAPLVDAIQKHGRMVSGEEVPALGSPLDTDVCLFCEAGIYGTAPRTVLESHAKRADERLDLEDLRRATKVIARTLKDLLI